MAAGANTVTEEEKDLARPYSTSLKSVSHTPRGDRERETKAPEEEQWHGEAAEEGNAAAATSGECLLDRGY